MQKHDEYYYTVVAGREGVGEEGGGRGGGEGGRGGGGGRGGRFVFELQARMDSLQSQDGE